LVLSSIFALVACGGGGGNGGGSTAATAPGIYEGNFDTRANGRILIGVLATGQLSVAIDDSEGGVYFGTGTLRADNGFTVVCANGTGLTVTISGTLSGSGVGRSFNGTIAAGTFSATYRAAFQREPQLGQFVGNVQGRFTGKYPDQSTNHGRWEAALNADGTATGTWIKPGANISLNGTISPAGFLHLTGSGSTGAVELNGNMTLTNGLPWGTGTFTDGTLRGSFYSYGAERGRVLINKLQPDTHPPRTGVYAIDFSGGSETRVGDLITGAFTHAATEWSQFVFSTNDGFYIKPGDWNQPVEIGIPNRSNTLFVHAASFTDNGGNLAFSVNGGLSGGGEGPVTFTSPVVGNTILASQLVAGMTVVSWYPDGRSILCREASTGHYYRVPTDGTTPIAVPNAGSLFDIDGVSGRILAINGGWIGYYEAADLTFVPLVELGQPHPALKGVFWSGDGRFAIYAVENGATFDLMRVSVDGGLPQRIKVLTSVEQPVDSTPF
jgi:hypothetical protein